MDCHDLELQTEIHVRGRICLSGTLFSEIVSLASPKDFQKGSGKGSRVAAQRDKVFLVPMYRFFDLLPLLLPAVIAIQSATKALAEGVDSEEDSEPQFCCWARALMPLCPST